MKITKANVFLLFAMSFSASVAGLANPLSVECEEITKSVFNAIEQGVQEKNRSCIEADKVVKADDDQALPPNIHKLLKACTNFDDERIESALECENAATDEPEPSDPED